MLRQFPLEFLEISLRTVNMSDTASLSGTVFGNISSILWISVKASTKKQFWSGNCTHEVATVKSTGHMTHCGPEQPFTPNPKLLRTFLTLSNIETSLCMEEN